MSTRILVRGKVCQSIVNYCKETYGDGTGWSLYSMAETFNAIYEFDRDVMCDVMLFKNEEDVLFFKLKIG